MENIKLSNGETIKLPKGFVAQRRTDFLGYIVYFVGHHRYIPYEENRVYAKEIIKELLLLSGMKPKEIIKFLTV